MTFLAKALATLGLALLAVTGNIINLPLFFGVHFIFGSVAVMLAVRLLGLWPAALVALAGGAYTWILWGHPYAMLTFTLEAIVVSLLYQRGTRNLVLADLAFWLVAGVTLLPMFYMGVLGMDLSAASMIALKQSLNGLFNTLMAGLLIKVMVWRFQNGSVSWLPTHIRLNELLFHILLTLALIAGSAPIIIGSYAAKLEREKGLATALNRVLSATEERLQEQPYASQVLETELLRYASTDGIAGIALLNTQGQPIAQAGKVTTSSTESINSLTSVNNLKIWLPDSGGSLVNRWKAGLYQYRLPVTGLQDGVELIADKPAASLIQAVEEQRNQSFAFLAGMTLLSILVSFSLSRVLTRPLAQLDKASKHLPERIRLQKRPELPGSRVREYDILSASLQTMGNTLAHTFAELDKVQTNLERDVLARTRELANTSAMLSNVLEASTELAIIATDPGGTITLFNIGAENLLGYDSNEVVGTHSPALFHLSSEIEERSQELSEEVGESVSGFDIFVKHSLCRGSETREWTYVTKLGATTPVVLTVTPIRDDSGRLTGFLGIAQDVTERKRIEQIKNEFISTVSHELRTPLTSVSGALGLVLAGKLGNIPEKAQKLLDTAHRNSKRLAHLINDLLDIEKIAEGKLHFNMQIQPLLPILEQAVEDNRTYGTERNIKLELTSDLAEGKVRVDEQRLKQVLANLLSNAVKYSPDGGSVTVAAARTDTDITVSVTDQGSGIPEDFQHKIFQRFAQADSSDTRKRGGTGLGLAITQELITRMGGTIHFETTEGKGTRFYFKLPAIDPGKTAPSAPQSDADDSVIKSPKILVVEDDPDVARLLKIMLEDAGYRVVVCHTGSEALESAKTGEYNLISLDLMLPDISGLDIIRRLKKQTDTENIPIVVVSAKVTQGELELNGEVDNIAWLAKPIDYQKLIDLVQHQLSDGSRPKILHIEDDVDLHNILSAMVSDQLILEPAGTIADAKALLKQHTYDAVLLDIGLPDGSGWDLIPDIEHEQPGVAIVILSGEDVSKERHATVEGVLLKNRLTSEQLVSVIRDRIHGMPATRFNLL
ncbi:ATP-binding protein [Marinobacter halophilus]|uniref:histidine kinase n=1 Tax=Marinobacter halophilus TaxID=1323740 RepID=A0A2T1KIW1_9GAMM|nr:ATP-binding protein [Marinobacter halophilus]PSF10081.1 histidine kinase [Marinobacter halophilus]GGC67597.1 hypothetical protein GCM10011362_15090 [Marinobacter halophilus]